MNDTTSNHFGRPTATSVAFEKLAIWVHQDLADRDDTLLLRAKPEAWLGGIYKVTLKADQDGTPFFCLTSPKPRGEGITERDVDPEGLAILIGLCLPDGRVAIEPKGDGAHYYLRLYVGGKRADGKVRRAQVAPVVAGTPTGKSTAEADYHSLRRRDLCHAKPSEQGHAPAMYGTQEAKDFALDRWRELAVVSPELLPRVPCATPFYPAQDAASAAGTLGRLLHLPALLHEQGFAPNPALQRYLDETAYAALLEALHSRLKAVPIGLRREAA